MDPLLPTLDFFLEGASGDSFALFFLFLAVEDFFLEVLSDEVSPGIDLAAIPPRMGSTFVRNPTTSSR